MNSELAYILGRKFCNGTRKFRLQRYEEMCKRNIKCFDCTTDQEYAELLSSPEFSCDFARGMYESTYNTRNSDIVQVACRAAFLDMFKNATRANGSFVNGIVTFTGCNALDFLNFVYSKGKSDYSQFCYKKYVLLCRGKKAHNNNVTEFKFKKLVPEAVAPFKDRASDSGYDLTLLKLNKRVGNTFWYSTGISVEPPNGFYFDLVPRSSLSKTGFMLANSIGVIDRSYTGDIIVALNQIDHTMPDLELPFRAVQIIPRKIQHMLPVQVDELGDTDRAGKGFGSSDGTFKSLK
jgi:dUTP pyrophosphatase